MAGGASLKRRLTKTIQKEHIGMAKSYTFTIGDTTYTAKRESRYLASWGGFTRKLQHATRKGWVIRDTSSGEEVTRVTGGQGTTQQFECKTLADVLSWEAHKRKNTEGG